MTSAWNVSVKTNAIYIIRTSLFDCNVTEKVLGFVRLWNFNERRILPSEIAERLREKSGNFVNHPQVVSRWNWRHCSSNGEEGGGAGGRKRIFSLLRSTLTCTLPGFLRPQFYFIPYLVKGVFDPAARTEAGNLFLSVSLSQHVISLPPGWTHRSRNRPTSDHWPSGSVAASTCDQLFVSDAGKNGTLSSPQYPSPYPSRSHCRYDFQGRGKERIQIVFTDFDLYHTAEDNKEWVTDVARRSSGVASFRVCPRSRCEILDSLNAFVHIDGRMEKIDSFCGSAIPKPLMSNGPRLMLEFRGIYSSRHVRGFRASYRFTESEYCRSRVRN